MPPPPQATPPAATAAAVQHTVPVLASLDFAQTQQFYGERLGFDCLLHEPDYLILARDGCELHFWRCGDRHIAEHTSCYVRGDTGALYADFSRRGLAPLKPPVVQPWGMKEMYVIDPHGNLLKFGEPA